MSDSCRISGPVEEGGERLSPDLESRWASRPTFALDADVTVYWPQVRPCWEDGGEALETCQSGWPVREYS